MIQILIADDHAIIRDGLCRMLGCMPDMQVIVTVDNGADAVQAAENPEIKVAIIDLSLPHVGGIDLVRILRERRPDMGLVVFSMQSEDLLATHLVRAGILGYVCKDRPVSELVAAIRAAAEGKTSFSPKLLALLEEKHQDSAPHHSFSVREAQVFELLLAGKSVRDIAETMEIGGSTASTHLSRVREKLGVTTNAEVLLYARRVGLI